MSFSFLVTKGEDRGWRPPVTRKQVGLGLLAKEYPSAGSATFFFCVWVFIGIYKPRTGDKPFLIAPYLFGAFSPPSTPNIVNKAWEVWSCWVSGSFFSTCSAH